MKLPVLVVALAASLGLAACVAPSSGQAPSVAAHAGAASHAVATGNAPRPYAIPETEVLEIHSAILDRDYELFVALPESYATHPGRRYPVVFVTDANYAFPLVRAISRRVGDHGHGLEDFILVGLSYAKGDTPAYSRRRDYTPTPRGPRDAGPDASGRPALHGGAEPYRQHLLAEVFPRVAGSYRADMRRKVFAGHSYGALLGAHILFTEPSMFSHYILGSPSLWYDSDVMFKREARYAASNRDLAADVFLGIGEYEQTKPASADPRYSDGGDMVGDMHRFRRTLAARNYPGLRIDATVIPGEDHLTVAPVIITRGLQRALPSKE